MKTTLSFLVLLILTISCENNQPPTCEIVFPSDGAEFLVGDSIMISANADDSDGNITEVRFYVNDIGEQEMLQLIFNRHLRRQLDINYSYLKEYV